jgi:hypothetical protein
LIGMMLDSNGIYAYNTRVLMPRTFMLNPRGTMLHPHVNRLRMVDGPSKSYEMVPAELFKGIVLGILQSPAMIRLNQGIDITERIEETWVPEPNTMMIRFVRGPATDEIRIDMALRPDGMVRISVSHWDDRTPFSDAGVDVVINRRSLNLQSMWFSDRDAARERANGRLDSRWVDEVEYLDSVYRPEYSVRLLDGDWLWTAVVDPNRMSLEWLFA